MSSEMHSWDYLVGYARVAPLEQDAALQRDALDAARVESSSGHWSARRPFGYSGPTNRRRSASARSNTAPPKRATTVM